MVVSIPPTVCHNPHSDAERAMSQLPRLAKGRHKLPGDQACVMEVVSVLYGERWSDHPACVHPTLAAVARLVNDRVSDAGRHHIAELIPRMADTAGTAGSDPLAGARMVVRCAELALRHDPGPLRTELEFARCTARYRLSPDNPCTWPVRWTLTLLRRIGLLNRLYGYNATLQATRAVALAARQATEPELLTLLDGCVEDCRAQADQGGREAPCTRPVVGNR
jgi:hypothetical protein